MHLLGFKDLPKEIEPTLRSTLIDLIENKNVNKFYDGNNGNLLPANTMSAFLDKVDEFLR